MNIAGVLARLTMIRAVVLGFFFTSLYYFFMYDNGMVQTNGIAAAAGEMARQQKQLEELNQKLDRAHEYQRSAAEMGEAFNRLLSYIPENYRLQDFMKVLSEQAKISGLNIIRISEGSAGAKDKRPEFEEMTVTVELNGSFAQQMTFLSNLTKQKQIFVVDSFHLDAASTGQIVENESPALSFKADIKAYRYTGGKPKS